MILLEKRIKFAKSKFGRIEFKYDEGMSSRGDGTDWVENTVAALLDGKNIGHLSINYIPQSKFNAHYKDILKFIVVQHGADELGDAIKSGDTKQLIVKMANLTGTSHDLDVKSNHDLEWWKNKYFTILKKLESRYNKEFKRFKEYWVDKPMVDYIKVDGKYQNGGVGFGLYIAGALWMAEKRFSLRSGYSQSESAIKAWKKMERMGLPVKTVKDAGIIRKSLDYR